MSALEGVFYLFPKFPTEIRLAIWRECLPRHIMELDDQQDDLIWDEPPCSMNWKITWTNAAPPVIARVCRESRAVAFESGRPQLLPDENNPDTYRFSNYMVKQPWLDTARDAVHLNWEPSVDIEWQSYDWGDPVRCLMWYAARTRSRQASIMLGLLQDFQHRENPDQPHEHYRWTRRELADLMRTKTTSWMVVILPPVVIHADVETSAGLFGLLADARVQLVDADDKARIKEFMALGEAPNATIGARFGQEDLVSAKEALRDAVRAVFGSEDEAPVMRPAVMFRLCTRMCSSAN
ncbi:2EXR domain-containing protein [Aspergillus thermomutatus]|uniref:2EXR domain-containing protein n=1 Tax=Aspergillus thermomutatus TaxID=41047 RepID=A0A397GA03_ASPTH|nr:uncharacterized protein CDV56_104197 [Aspergillus thermomutatus]RHZ45753.1 hypothetical protein CDV56_104197 [Aspergillus thermomutatus]